MITPRDDAPEPDPLEALEEGLRDLKALSKQQRPQPSRRHARAVLVPLGELLPGSPADVVAANLERVREATRGFPEAWSAAVRDELQLACSEYVMSVDERYLGMEDYDFDYTSSARERLEARLRASEALGLALPEGMRRRIADADAIYAPYAERRKNER